MEKLTSSSKVSKIKDKSKKPVPKPKPNKKKKSDSGATCSTFLSELTRKFTLKKKQEEESPRNVVQSIIEGLIALPIKFASKSGSKTPSVTVTISEMVTGKLETVNNKIPERIPEKIEAMEVVEQPNEELEQPAEQIELPPQIEPSDTKFPRMPLINSDVFKPVKRVNIPKAETSTNTGNDHDIATEITKHVNTLRKISLIADEFNQKTARNLKEIVNSVQEDLIRKLEEIRTEQQATAS